MRLFVGLVSVQIYVSYEQIDKHNELYTVWANSREEALGWAVEEAMKKHAPKGKVVFTMMHDRTDVALQKMQWKDGEG